MAMMNVMRMLAPLPVLGLLVLAGCAGPVERAEPERKDNGQVLVPYTDWMGGGATIEDVRSVEESKVDRQVRLLLELRMERIDVKEVGFEKVVNQLRDAMPVNIFVNWTALQTVDVDRATP